MAKRTKSAPEKQLNGKAVELTWTGDLVEGRTVIARVYDPHTQANAGGTRFPAKIARIHVIDGSRSCSAWVGGLCLGFKVLKNKAIRDGLIE